MNDRQKQNIAKGVRRNANQHDDVKLQKLTAQVVTIEVIKNKNEIEIKAHSTDSEIVEIDFRLDTSELHQFYHQNSIKLQLSEITFEHTLEVWAMDAKGNTSDADFCLWKSYSIYMIDEYPKKSLRNAFYKLGVKNINVEKIPFEKQAILFNALKRLLFKYPQAKKFIRTVWAEDLSSREIGGYCKMQFLSDGAYVKIAVDENLFNLKDEILKYTIYHEFGHVLNAVMAIKRMNEKIGFLNYEKILEFQVAYDTTAREIRDEINAHDHEIVEMLSRYAFVSPAEYFAEAFMKKNYYFENNKIVGQVFEKFYNKI